MSDKKDYSSAQFSSSFSFSLIADRDARCTGRATLELCREKWADNEGEEDGDGEADVEEEEETGQFSALDQPTVARQETLFLSVQPGALDWAGCSHWQDLKGEAKILARHWIRCICIAPLY